ncbi:MAG: hypothetical protein ACT4TC_14530 [Myxococcaceae bacterium]
MDASTDSLSPKVSEILGEIPDRKLSTRLRKVYAAAANAVSRLSDMDLVKYETHTLEESPDLSLWEAMAPVIRDTVVDVNALLSVIRENFPINPSGGIADLLSKAVNETGSGNWHAEQAEQAEQVLQNAVGSLAQQITQLGEQMRSPSVVSDRWNLLAELQAVRTRFREQIGSLVFNSLAVFGEVHRKDVVPGHREELKAAVTVRATVADLTRILSSRFEKIRTCEQEDVQWNAQQLEKDLDVFGKTPAYKALRAQDKRTIIEFRSKLGKISQRAMPPKDELVELMEPFAKFVESLSQVNNREILVLHDREVWAACGVKLEQVELHLESDPIEAARMLAESAATGQALYGRDASLDAFLRKARKTSLASLSGPDLREELERFRQLLASLPVY